MKKLVKYVVSIMLIFAMIFSVVGCGKNKKTDNNTTKLLLNTIHGGKAEKLDKYIVKDGVNQGYTIVLPSNATVNEIKSATSVFSYFFNEATDLNITVKYDNEVSFDGNSKYFVFGNVSFLPSEVVFDEKTQTTYGFVIKTVGNSIFVNGGDTGIKYASYELLKYLFNFEYYASYCYEIDKNVRNLSLYDFDIKEAPDIEIRQIGMGDPRYSDDTFYLDGIRLNNGYEYDIVGWTLDYPETGRVSSSHTSMEYVSYEEYGKEHRDWFSNTTINGIPTQLCYSRHFEEYVDIIVEKMGILVTDFPLARTVDFSISDLLVWCDCDSCKEVKNQYGTDAAVYMMALNEIGRRFEVWCNEHQDIVNGRKIYVRGMMYLPTEDAPVKYNESKQCYEPIDDKVKAHNNVSLVYAIHSTCNYYVPFSAKENERENKNTLGWAAILDGNPMAYWVYNQFEFANYMMFYDNYSSMQENYTRMVETNAYWVLDQGQHDNHCTSAFNILRQYLSSKLAWNCQVDYGTCLNNFFRAYFGEAEEDMRNLFEAMRNHWAKLFAQGKITGSTFVFTDEIMMPYGMLKTLENCINSAYSSIESLKTTDIKKYEILEKRICLESIWIRFNLIHYHYDKYTSIELEKLRKDFVYDCYRVDLSKYGENRPLTDITKEWGI